MKRKGRQKNSFQIKDGGNDVKKYVFSFSKTFDNLSLLENTIKMNKLLQRGLAFLMEHRHYPIAALHECFGMRLLVNMMKRKIEKDHITKEKVL